MTPPYIYSDDKLTLLISKTKIAPPPKKKKPHTKKPPLHHSLVNMFMLPVCLKHIIDLST